jgi:hypothetical protein
MPYRIAGSDVHKKMLAVVVADIAVEGEYPFERRQFSSSPDQLRVLAAWLIEREVQEAVLESTAQDWKPVWNVLERYGKPVCPQRDAALLGALHWAQAKSNRAPGGRKQDFGDAERLVRGLVAQELVLSFVPDAEQRLGRTGTRRKQQLTQDRVRLQNQREGFLEEAHIKLSSLVSDLLGLRGRRMLKALAEGEKDPAALAALADRRLRATPPQLCDALGACTLQQIEEQMDQLDQEVAALLQEHQDAVQRIAEVPGLGGSRRIRSSPKSVPPWPPSLPPSNWPPG